MLLIPISFVNEHIETLHELDIEYAKELAAEVSAAEDAAVTPLVVCTCMQLTPLQHSYTKFERLSTLALVKSILGNLVNQVH